MKTMNFGKYNCVVKQSHYEKNGNLAIILLDKINGSPVAVATVNLNEKLPQGQAFIKDYSENLGMLKALKDAGLIKKVLGVKPMNWVEFPLVEINLDNIDYI